MAIRGLIFDFDGLILDTEIPIYEAWRESYRDHGHDLPLDDYVGCVGSDFGGFDPKGYLESLVGYAIQWEELDRARSEKARELIFQKDPLPGVVDLLKEAREHPEIRCAVASSSPREWVEPLLERLELSHYFEFTRCLDDVRKPKPSPELFITAAEGLSISSDEALVFEDSLNGLRAATAAGIRCVAVPNAITEALDFSGARLKVASLAELTLNEIIERV